MVPIQKVLVIVSAVSRCNEEGVSHCRQRFTRCGSEQSGTLKFKEIAPYRGQDTECPGVVVDGGGSFVGINAYGGVHDAVLKALKCG